jgi:hypothetical protein
MSENFYVYGIVRAQEAPQVVAPAVFESDNPILSLAAAPFVALVSRIAIREVDATRRNMLAHARVIERAMDTATVLPMRFGMIVPDEESLRQRLRANEAAIKATLADLDGRIEVGLRIAFADGVATREIGLEQPQLARRGEALSRRNANETYYERIDLGRTIEAALIDKKKREGQRLLARVKPLAVRAVELGIQDENGILNAALLVERALEPRLAAEIDAIDGETSGRLAIRYVAPAPPFNFVRLSLQDGQAAALKGAA